jgi:hypothetical protein
MTDIFENIKVGDTVFYHNRGFSNSYLKPEKVTKVSKTMFSINGTADRFRREDGRAITSDRWGGSNILPYTDENKHIYEIQQKRQEIDGKWERLKNFIMVKHIPEDRLNKVNEILDTLTNVVKKE